MYEFDVAYKKEEINDNCKITNEAITVTITLGEYRCLVSENVRLNCDNTRLYEKLNEKDREIEELKKQCPIN